MILSVKGPCWLINQSSHISDGKLPSFCDAQVKEAIRGNRQFPKVTLFTPFHFDHLPTQVPKCSYWIQVLESAIIFAHCFEGWVPYERFVSKKPKKLGFLVYVRFET